MKWILGINAPYPGLEGNASLLQEGILHSAISEERLSRTKYDGHVKKSIATVLQNARLAGESVSAVGLVGFGNPLGMESFRPAELQYEWIANLYREKRVFYCESHHLAHALSAMVQMPFRRAIIAVLDHTGSLLERRYQVLEHNRAEQASYYLATDVELIKIGQDFLEPSDVGFGRLFADVTIHLGLGTYNDAGKTMGLAAFGKPGAINATPFARGATGEYKGNLRSEPYLSTGAKDIENWLAQQTGLRIPARDQSLRIAQPHMDLARWVQENVQTALADRLKTLLRSHMVEGVCIAGGVALNSVMNSYH